MSCDAYITRPRALTRTGRLGHHLNSSNLARVFMPDDLPFGLYERLLTADLKARLLQFGPADAHVGTHAVDPAEAHLLLARHIQVIVAGALRALPADQRE